MQLLRKKVLFHAPYSLEPPTSGSVVHPYRIREAFIELGCEVTTIGGSPTQRRRQILDLKREDLDMIDFCYSSPSSYPVHPLWDYLFYLKILRTKVPLGVFYGDAYWKFTPEWIQQKSAKKWLLQLRYRTDLMVIKRAAQVVFVPSQTLANFLPYPRMETLHPGANIRYSDSRNNIQSPNPPYSIIYVGSISPRYGLKILLEAIDLVNQLVPASLNLICPLNQLIAEQEILAPYRLKPWLNIQHLTHNQLEEIYHQSDLGIIPLRQNLYNNLAMPVKLFEYLSFGLPVIVTNCTEMAAFVTQTGIGLVAEDNPESLARQIHRILIDSICYQKAAKSVRFIVKNGHLWTDRARTITHCLTDQ